MILRDRKLLVDLIVFEMSYFDMILGIDFLSIKFSLDNRDEFTFHEGQVLSMMISK